MKLLLFNPETEYALASGASFYTPPASVEMLRKEHQLLPEVWAEKEDIILVDDLDGLKSEFRLVQWDMLEDLFQEIPDLEVEPWGWNAALVRRMLDCGVPESKLPGKNVVRMIRDLAHRRTTVQLVTLWNKEVDGCQRVDVPIELRSIDECMEFYRDNQGCWLKAPWSSSGRGVINTGADMTDLQVEQWCRGILRRQGSILGETGAERIADYATEWRIYKGNAEYLGLSSFSTSNRGKYISNNVEPQALLQNRFDKESNMGIETVVSLQKTILERVLQGYEGLCGVDMLIESSGKLRPFVELNLRRTMGMLHIIR